MALASVLIVDDDEKVRNALRRDLSLLDYTLHFADRPSAALEVLRSDPVDIIISDNMMPGMTGLQFLRIVRQRYPHVIRIMLTGAATLQTAITAINQDEIFRFLEKPWDEQALGMALLQACERIKQRASAS